MSYEAKYPIAGSDVVFRETFHSAADVVRNGGTITGGVSFSSGVASTDGVDGVLKYPLSVSSNGSWSMRVKVKIPVLATRGICEFGDSLGRAGIFLSALGKIYTIFSNGANTRQSLSLSSPIAVNVSAEIIITHTSGVDSALLYVDGDPITIGSPSNGGGTETYDILSVGRGNTAVDAFLRADYDLVEIYNRALTPAEVSNLYNKTQYKGLVTDGLVGYWDFTRQTCFDWSGNGNNGVLTTGNGGFLKQGLLCDGSATKVEVGNIAQTLKTIGIVVKLDTTTEELIDVNGTNKMGVNTGTLACNGFASEYIDGVLIDTVVTAKKDYYLVVTDAAGVLASDFDIGENALGGIVKAIHVNTTQLSIEQIEQNRQYFRTQGYLNG